MLFKLIVFDLDFTLWNAGGTWCDHTCPPYRKLNDYIIDSENNKITLFPDTVKILESLCAEGYLLGLASRTYQPSWALKILQLFNIAHYFRYKEIYPGSKSEHFKQLRNKSGLQFSDMIFFDDELRNIEDVEILGVKVVLVNNGISVSYIERYIR